MKRTDLNQDYKVYEPQLDSIWHCVAEVLGCNLNVVSNRCRAAVFTEPRHIFFYLVRKYTRVPLAAIGHYAGGRDHSTVINGNIRVEEHMTWDKQLKKTVQRIEEHMIHRIAPEEDPLLNVHQYPPFLGFIG